MEFGKPLLFMITAITIFSILISGMASSFSNGKVANTSAYFQSHDMPELELYTFLYPYEHWDDVNGNGIHNTDESGIDIENYTISEGWNRLGRMVMTITPSIRFFPTLTGPAGGGDAIQTWVVNPAHTGLALFRPDMMRIVFYQEWGIWDSGDWSFSYQAILDGFDNELGYSLMSSNTMSLNYYCIVIPDNSTDLATDLQYNVNYTIYCAVHDADASKLQGGAWAMITHIMTFSVPQWNNVVGLFIGAFVDGFILLFALAVAITFIPLINGGKGPL